MIQTIPTTNQNQSRQGLFAEIEDIEARNEEYPLTRAMLKLIDTLTDHGLPDGLGMGSRVPGFKPYFNFIRDHIFLKFSTRAYKNMEEKWEIGALVLKLILKLLKDYTPNVQEFNAGQGSLGFGIMTHLLQTSQMLRLMLHLLDEAMTLLETYETIPGQEQMENCCLQILKLLNEALKLQTPMLECARMASTSNLILTALSSLLLAVNPRTGQPDHMLNVVKFVLHSWRLPQHGLSAIQVIRLVGKSSVTAQNALLTTFRGHENLIIKGFADVLDNEDTENANVEEIKLAAINLLLDGLELPAPTLTHFLLGFNLNKGIAKSTLQAQGVLGAVRSPFHAILSLLRPVNGELSPAFERQPNLAVASTKLIYSLCSNMATFEVTLRFLRSSEDFFCTQISMMPFGNVQAMAWILKAASIEAKWLCQERQRSQILRLSSLLLDSIQKSKSSKNEVGFLSQLSRAHMPTMNLTSQQPRGQHRLFAILEAIDFTEETLHSPNYEIFDQSQVDGVLKQCQAASMIDVKSLHKILNSELAQLQNNTTNGLGKQRELIQEEIKLILNYALQWNQMQERKSSRKTLLDAWRQLTEILLCAMPTDQVLSAPGSKQRLILELLQMLLNKVLADGALLEMTNQVSGVVLLLMTALRQTYSGKNKKDLTSNDRNNETFISILDAGNDLGGETQGKLYSAALQAILKGLLMWIIGTSAAAQRVRANLYGALLNYLRIGKTSSTPMRNSDEERLKKANLEVLHGYGDAFLDVVCRDAVSGHEIRMMLALSLLDELICLEGRGAWLYYLSKQGYLRHIIESLVSEDNQLANLVNSRPDDHLKALYTYETKMALLTRVASTATGSEMLLESSLMVKMAEMTVFSSRPETSNANFDAAMDDGFMPSALSRYQQIVFPAYKLCQAILASLGSDNRSASSQVLHFITNHECLVRVGLHYSNLFNLSGLQELSLLTGVIARSISLDSIDSDSPELASHLSRIQRQMIALMAHFGQNECIIKKMANGNLFPEEHKAKAVKLVLEISTNCMTYAASIMGKGKKDNDVF